MGMCGNLSQTNRCFVVQGKRAVSGMGPDRYLVASSHPPAGGRDAPFSHWGTQHRFPEAPLPTDRLLQPAGQWGHENHGLEPYRSADQGGPPPDHDVHSCQPLGGFPEDA